jgi:PAS domain S-box-containing protein
MKQTGSTTPPPASPPAADQDPADGAASDDVPRPLAAQAQGGHARAWIVGLGAVLAAVVLRVALNQLAGTEAVYLPFGLAILGAAWYAGARAGLIAVVPSALFASFVYLDPPPGGAERVFWFGVFVLTGAVVVWALETLRWAQQNAEAHAAAAERARSELEQHMERNAASRRDADRALRESEMRFRLLVESVADYAIFMLDPDGRVMSWNAGADRITGYGAEEVIGRHFSVFHPAEEQRAGKPVSILKSALSRGRHEDDGWRVRKDGSRLWANVLMTPLRQDGELIGFAKVVRDLTARHASDVLLESVLDSAIDGIIGIDQFGCIRSFNAAAEHMFGYEAADLIGQRFSVLLPEPYRTNAMEYLTRYSQSGQARVGGSERQLVGLRRDATTFPLELAVSEFELAESHYFTGVVRDVSRQQALETQLQQAQKMQAIGQLAGGVAHDFNNLLTIIAGHTELLLGKHTRQDDLQRALTDIRDAGSRAASLTRQLLAFSRRAVLEPRVLDLNAVVLETERLLRRIVSENIDMVTRLAPDLRSVSVDQSQIGQVLVNLVVNARDAIEHHGCIEIETANCELEAGDGGRGVALIVRDNGSGMIPDIVKHIFEPFFTTKQTGAGTGLGLSMVYGIVRPSGGHVEVSSELGVGSEFRVILPAAKERPVALRTARAPEEPLPMTIRS